MKARKTLHVAYACDSHYVGQTMVSMASLLEHHTKQDIILHLVEDQIGQPDIDRITRLAGRYGTRLLVSPLHGLLGELPHGLFMEGDGRHPMSIYAKLFLDQVCSAERVLYLDSDTIVSRSLLPLWEMDFGSACAAGVQMPYSPKVKALLGMKPQDCYVCDGILMIHLRNWRKRRCRERCVDYIRRRHGDIPMQSEGVINHVLRGRIQVLPPAYNLMSSMLLWDGSQMERLYGATDYYSDDEIRKARAHPVIIHYLDELYVRPWYVGSDHPYRAYYDRYARMAGISGKRIRPMGGWRGIRTRAVRVLDACLPFAVFCRIYRMVKGMR